MGYNKKKVKIVKKIIKIIKWNYFKVLTTTD